MRGSCHCGAVRYEVTRLSGPIVHCHCVTCRKTHSAAYASTAGVAREDFRWLEGRDRVAFYESSPGKTRAFCSSCGCHIVAERESQAHVILRVATLDEDPGARPRMRIWRSHDLPWLVDEEGVEAYPEWPPDRK